MLQLEETLRDAHLADPVAGLAGDGFVALGRATATAGVALHEFGDVNFHGMAEHGLTEFDLQFVFEIRAAEYLGAPAAAAATTEDIAEHLTEHFTECVGALLTTARTATLACGVDARMPMLVVDGPLVRFAENFVSLLGFLEFLFRVLVIRIAVRMKFHGKTAVGLLDVGLGRGARQIEHLVVITFRHYPPLHQTVPHRRRCGT